MALVIVVEESVTVREQYVSALREAGIKVLSASNVDEAMTLIDLLAGPGTLLAILLGTTSKNGLLSFIRNRLAVSQLQLEEHASLATAVEALKGRSPSEAPVIYKIYSPYDLPESCTEELELLFKHCLRCCGQLCGKVLNGYSSAALERLCAHTWPGGVRQIKEVVARLVEVSTEEQITLKDLAALQDADLLTFPLPLGVPLKELNRRYALLVLETVGGNKSEAARMLGVSIKTFQRRMAQWSSPDGAEEEE